MRTLIKGRGEVYKIISEKESKIVYLQLKLKLLDQF